MKNKVPISQRVEDYLREPEGETFKRGKWRFWFLALAGLSALNAILTASIFGANKQAFINSITLAVGALVAWLCVGTLHYSDSRDARLARGVSLLDSITLCFVILHFCGLLYVQGHLLTIQAQEAEYKASAATFNEKAEKISSDNVKIAEAGANAAREVTKTAKLQNDTAYQLRRAAETGNVTRARIGRGFDVPAPTSAVSLAAIELEKPKAPEQSSAAFLMKWDAWIRAANFGELILAAITLIFIRNRSAKTNTPREIIAGLGIGMRNKLNPASFDGEASRSGHVASPEIGEASPEGLRELQEVCSSISFHTPGRWFAVDMRGDHVRIRLRTRVEGREETLSTTRLTLEVLRDVLTMERSAFRARLEKFLKGRGFEI